MRAGRGDPLDETPEERLAETMDAFDLTEALACRALRMLPSQHLGLDAGRLSRERGWALRRTARRLAHRTGAHRYVVLLCVDTGQRVRLPIA